MKPILRYSMLPLFVWLVAANSLVAQSNSPQPAAFGICKPISQRTTEVGCWILVDQPVGRIEHPRFSGT